MREKIAFLGHSTASWAGYDIFGTHSFIDMIIDHFDYELVALGVREGSEERILDTLKKLELVDIAVIFHSGPSFLYLPGCYRDVDITKFDDAKAEYLWKKDALQYDAYIDHYYSEYGGIKETFKEVETFLNTLVSYKKFLYTPSVHENRYYGAVQQIDQYCLAKTIKCLHIPQKNNFPKWLEIKSGSLHPEIQELVSYYWEKGYPNGVNAEGQTMIYNALVQLLQRLR